jgi:hypothetical protein
VSVLASEFVFDQAELTFLAELCGKNNFPGAPPPELDDKAWTPVVRGLLARGVVFDTEPPAIADEVAVMLDVVFSSERSLWVDLVYRPGEGENAAWVLWVKGDTVVRQTLMTSETHRLVVCGRSELDGLLATVLDVRISQDSREGEPQTLSYADYCAASQLNFNEGPGAVADRYPAAEAYAQALTDGRRSIAVEERASWGVDARSRMELKLVESPTGLWLYRRSSPVEHGEDGSGVVVMQRVTLDMAREQMTALILAPGERPAAALVHR